MGSVGNRGDKVDGDAARSAGGKGPAIMRGRCNMSLKLTPGVM